MTNSDVMQFLQDEFGEYDLMTFCEVYSRFCELTADNDILNSSDKHYDRVFFKEKAVEIKEELMSKGAFMTALNEGDTGHKVIIPLIDCIKGIIDNYFTVLNSQAGFVSISMAPKMLNYIKKELGDQKLCDYIKSVRVRGCAVDNMSDKSITIKFEY